MIFTQRLLLRPWKQADREPFYQMCSDPLVMRYFPALLTRAESDAMADRIEAHLAQRGFTLYAAEERKSGEFIGFIGLFAPAFLDAVEIGWRLAPAWWNQGLATEGARAVLRLGFNDLGFQEIVSFTAPANQASRRVMEKIGMTYDPTADFDHPRIPEGHPLRRHVLYRVRREAWEGRRQDRPQMNTDRR